MKSLIMGAMTIGISAGLGLAQASIDVSGMQSWGFDGDPLNETMIFDVPFNGFGVILGVQYDITVQTINESWLDEVNVRFGNSDGTFHGNWPDSFRPGAGDGFSGTQRYTGSFITDFHLNADSEVHISLFETGFDDNLNSPDAILLPGSTMTFSYFIPSPSTSALLGFGLLSATRRRRIA